MCGWGECGLGREREGELRGSTPSIYSGEGGAGNFNEMGN
jgi:hypothetical protein